MKKIQKIYKDLERELSLKILKELDSDYESLIENPKEWLTNMLLKQKDINNLTKETVDKIIKDLTREVEGWIEDTERKSIEEIEEEFKIIDEELKDTSKQFKSTATKQRVLITLLLLNEGIKYNTNKKYYNSANTIYNKRQKLKEPNNDMINKLITDTLSREYREPTRGITVNKKSYTADGYVSMISEANEKRIKHELKTNIYDNEDVDLVIVTTLGDSRPTHVEFQGNIYSMRGKHPDYPSIDVTGYGDVDGIETGINCRHRLLPYKEGINYSSQVDYDPAQVHVEYQISQQQRYLERQIRAAKREQLIIDNVATNPEAKKEAQRKVSQKQSDMRAFINKTGRKRKYNREAI